MTQTFFENSLKVFHQNPLVVFNNTLDKLSGQKVAITDNFFNAVEGKVVRYRCN